MSQLLAATSTTDGGAVQAGVIRRCPSAAHRAPRSRIASIRHHAPAPEKGTPRPARLMAAEITARLRRIRGQQAPRALTRGDQRSPGLPTPTSVCETGGAHYVASTAAAAARAREPAGRCPRHSSPCSVQGRGPRRSSGSCRGFPVRGFAPVGGLPPLGGVRPAPGARARGNAPPAAGTGETDDAEEAPAPDEFPPWREEHQRQRGGHRGDRHWGRNWGGRR